MVEHAGSPAMIVPLVHGASAPRPVTGSAIGLAAGLSSSQAGAGAPAFGFCPICLRRPRLGEAKTQQQEQTDSLACHCSHSYKSGNWE